MYHRCMFSFFHGQRATTPPSCTNEAMLMPFESISWHVLMDRDITYKEQLHREHRFHNSAFAQHSRVRKLPNYSNHNFSSAAVPGMKDPDHKQSNQ